MEVRIEAGPGPVEVTSGRKDLRFHVAGRTVLIDWDAIVGAGLARAPSAPTSVPREEIDSVPGGPRSIDVIPFGGRLVDRLNRLGATHHALLLAYDRRRSFQVFLRRTIRERSASWRNSAPDSASDGWTATGS